MSGVDDRIVNMQFNNKQFETNAAATMTTLEKLKSSLNFSGAKKGLDDLAVAGKNFTLNDIGAGVDGIASKFSALSVIGITALANITSKAVDTGLAMAKALTLDPIMDGFNEYELKMGSIQTILANTARYGTQLPEVTAALDNLNTYADKTIYNFGDMTKNIGLFTNAGIKIADATSEIKGFSNAAAASGTNAQGAAGAAYQLSQAMSAGKITLMDWRSLTNVGMGNKNMQDGVIALATAMGTFKGSGTDANAAQKDFNGSLEKGWLKADVMGNYLKIMAGDMDAAAMSALGLSQAQIDGFTASAKTAEEAATKVRTWTQLYGTLKEAVGSSWTDTFGLVLGDFNQATDLFTGISDTLGGVIGNLGNARNALVKGWVDLGGRQDLIDVGKNIYESIANIISPITKAWSKIFPPDGGSALKGFTGGLKIVSTVIRNITSALTKLQPIFEVLFGVFKIGFNIISGVIGLFVNLLGLLGGVGLGGVTGLVGGFAALIAKITEFINNGKYVTKFFDGLKDAQSAVIQPMVQFFGLLASAIAAFARTGDRVAFFDSVKGSLSAFAPLIDAISSKLQAASNWLQGMGVHLQEIGAQGNTALGKLGTLLSVVSGYLRDFVTGFSGVSAILTKGDFTGASKTFGWMEDSKIIEVLFNVRDALVGVKSAGDDVATTATNVAGKFQNVSTVGDKVSSIWSAISGAFSAVSKWLSPAVTQVGSFLSWIGAQVKRVIQDLSGQDILALINTGLFMAAYISIKRFMDQFRGLFESASESFEKIGTVFDTLTDHLKAMQNGIKADILQKIAIAIALLAASIWVLSTIDVKSLAAATVAITVLMKALMMTMSSFTESVKDTDVGKILALGVALTFIAGAILVLSAALKIFGSMDVGELTKGVVTLGVVLKLLAMALDAMPEKDMLQTAASLVVIAGAMNLFALAILAFSAMDIGTVGEGLAYMGLALLAIGTAMKTMPEKAMLRNAAALAILGASLQLLAVAILSFSAMDAGTVAEGLAYIAASLLVLAVGMKAMSGTTSGAIGLLVVSAALLALSVALRALGSMDLQTLGKALLAIVAVIAIFAGVSALLTPIIPVMMALSIAMGLLGTAMFLAGAGMTLFAGAFVLLGASGVAGAAGFTAAMVAILELLPLMAQQLGLAVLAFAKVIEEGGPAIIGALTTMLVSLYQSVIDSTPKFLEAVVTVLMAFLKAVQIVGPEYIRTMVTLILALVDAIVLLVPRFVDAGLKIIKGVLSGFASNMPGIIQAGTDIVVAFIKGIGDSALRIVNAAGDTIVVFMNGLATSIYKHNSEMRDAGGRIVGAIVDGLTGGFSSKAADVVRAAQKMISGIPDAIKNFLGIRSPSKVTTKLGQHTGQGMVNGLLDMGQALYKAALGLGKKAMNGLSDSLSNSDELLPSDIELNPVIKPVLDLTSVESDAKKLNGLLQNAPALSVSTSDNSAQSVAALVRADQQSADGTNAQGNTSSLTFIQNNNSPKEISAADTYRNTKNQLSQAKGALTP